ncbi:efflux transporter outer membrane subunit [Noviherbaspirillum pedocola]|uniref:Efflux transporter outer membrane subunit n=1 Tax=Noviherbaspirillum pedocola TaxID=2801341 RepID=A0A934SZD7_9BURK|nr:efflux transporter outer membrane subunit [Noviherbaspirillum pedocola]MBK4738469.1 efflux transporter outer membrane subunit [Noviherbaspirillum pedocola]
MRHVPASLRYALLMPAALLAACAVGPDYRRPELQAPASFRFEDKQAQDLANTPWWNQFDDDVLSELIATALRENRDLKIAAARVDQFIGVLRTTRSAQYPQVSALLNAERLRASEQGLTPIPNGRGATDNLFEGSLSVSWELDLFGRLRRQTEAARANLLASEEGRRATVLSLVSSVALSYVNLRSLDRQLEIANTTVASRAESLRIFRRRFEGGTVSELELTQSQAEYEDAVSRVPAIEAQIGQQEDALSILLGRDPGPITRGRGLDKLGLPAVPAGLPSDLLMRRPDLRQAEQNLVAANAQIGAARAQYFPSISLTGLLGSASIELSDLFSGPARAWSVATSVAMPIFTAGGIAGQVEQAEAIQQQTLEQYRKSIQVAFQEVDDNLIGYQKARVQLDSLGRQVATLDRQVKLARARYENGYTSYIEVLDAERSLFNAQLSYTQTGALVFSSVVNLYKAMGGGWVAQADTMAPKPAAGKQVSQK